MHTRKQQLWDPKTGIQRGCLVLSMTDTALLKESRSILGKETDSGISCILILAQNFWDEGSIKPPETRFCYPQNRQCKLDLILRVVIEMKLTSKLPVS